MCTRLRFTADGMDTVTDIGMMAGAMTIAKEGMEPTVAITALGKVVDQFDMAVALAERRGKAVEV